MAGAFLYSWGFSQYKARAHWLTYGHMTSSKETVSRQTSISGRHLRRKWATFFTSDDNSALLRASARDRTLTKGSMIMMRSIDVYLKCLARFLNCFFFFVFFFSTTKKVI